MEEHRGCLPSASLGGEAEPGGGRAKLFGETEPLGLWAMPQAHLVLPDTGGTQRAASWLQGLHAARLGAAAGASTAT